MVANPDQVLIFDTTLRSEEHTSELQSQSNLVCRLLLEKKKTHDDGDHRSAPNGDAFKHNLDPPEFLGDSRYHVDSAAVSNDEPHRDDGAPFHHMPPGTC